MRGSYSITKSRWHTAFTLCASWARSFSLATSVGLLLPPIEAGGDEFPMNFRLKSKKLGLFTEVPRIGILRSSPTRRSRKFVGGNPPPRYDLALKLAWRLCSH